MSTEPASDRAPGSAGSDPGTPVGGSDVGVKTPGSPPDRTLPNQIDPEGFYILRGDHLARFLWEAGGAVSRVFLELDGNLVMPSEDVDEALRQYVAATPEIVRAQIKREAVITNRPDLTCEICGSRLGHEHDPDCTWWNDGKVPVTLAQTSFKPEADDQDPTSAPAFAQETSWDDAAEGWAIATLGGVVLLTGALVGVVKKVRRR